jgi:hypothetical protein
LEICSDVSFYGVERGSEFFLHANVIVQNFSQIVFVLVHGLYDDTPSWVEPLEQHSEHYINSDDPIPFLNHITGRNIIETVYKNKKDLGKILDNDVSVKEKLASTFNAVKTYVGTNFQTWGTFYFFNREESNGYKAISFENLQKRADSNAMTGATTLAKKHSMDSYIMKFLEHKKRRYKLKY